MNLKFLFYFIILFISLNMNNENARGQYLLQLPQPCIISKVIFRINDRGHKIKRFHYAIEGSLTGADKGYQWKTA
jgi:hypothetical protein